MPSPLSANAFFAHALSERWDLDTQIACLCDFIDASDAGGRLRTLLWSRLVSKGLSVDQASAALPPAGGRAAEGIIMAWREREKMLRRQCLDPLVVTVMTSAGVDALVDYAKSWSPVLEQEPVYAGAPA